LHHAAIDLQVEQVFYDFVSVRPVSREEFLELALGKQHAAGEALKVEAHNALDL
jgi:hypothetical protein